MAEAKKLALAQRLFFLYFTKHGLPQTPRHTAAGTKFSGVNVENIVYNIKKKGSDKSQIRHNYPKNPFDRILICQA